MEISTGKAVFAISFIVVFIGIMVWSYRKDALLQKKYFKGTFKILLILFLIWVAFFAFVKLS